MHYTDEGKKCWKLIVKTEKEKKEKKKTTENELIKKKKSLEERSKWTSVSGQWY